MVKRIQHNRRTGNLLSGQPNTNPVRYGTGGVGEEGTSGNRAVGGVTSGKIIREKGPKTCSADDF